MGGRWDGTFDTVVPESGDTRPTVTDWRLQVFSLSHSGRTGANSCWGTGSCAGSCSGSGSGSGLLSAAASVAPSTAALAGAVFLEGKNELHVHHRELHCKSHDSGG